MNKKNKFSSKNIQIYNVLFEIIQTIFEWIYLKLILISSLSLLH